MNLATAGDTWPSRLTRDARVNSEPNLWTRMSRITCKSVVYSQLFDAGES